MGILNGLIGIFGDVFTNASERAFSKDSTLNKGIRDKLRKEKSGTNVDVNTTVSLEDINFKGIVAVVNANQSFYTI